MRGLSMLFQWLLVVMIAGALLFVSFSILRRGESGKEGFKEYRAELSIPEACEILGISFEGRMIDTPVRVEAGDARKIAAALAVVPCIESEVSEPLIQVIPADTSFCSPPKCFVDEGRMYLPITLEEIGKAIVTCKYIKAAYDFCRDHEFCGATDVWSCVFHQAFNCSCNGRNIWDISAGNVEFVCDNNLKAAVCSTS